MSFTSNPGYYDLIHDLYTSLKWFYRPDMMQNYSFPKSLIDDFQKYYFFEHDDYFLIIYIAIIITIIRYIFELYLCNVSIFFFNRLKSDLFYIFFFYKL